MIDCKRLLTILFHASTSKSLKLIKKTLIPICNEFNQSDVIIAHDRQFRGPAVAYIANYSLVSDDEFLTNVKNVFKEFHEINTDGKRCFMIITDHEKFLNSMVERLSKFEKIHLIRFHSNEQLTNQIKSIIED